MGISGLAELIARLEGFAKTAPNPVKIHQIISEVEVLCQSALKILKKKMK